MRLRGPGLAALLTALCLCLTLLSGCGETPVQTQLYAMDTVMLLTAYGDGAEAGLAQVSALLRDWDSALDPEDPDSPVYALNHSGTAALPAEALAILDTARTVYDRTGGALDLTVYPLVQAWGFLDGTYRVPEAAELAALLPLVDFSAVETDGDTVTLPAGAMLSFGAVAKGAAGQAAIDLLREAGVSGAILSLGGNVQTLGEKPDGSLWQVAVTDPEDTGSGLGILSVGETAVVTSGDYQRYFEQDGRRYAHILDPATGCPADSGLRSVTVVCADGTMADALSTALFVLGEDGALDYWRSWGGCELVLVTADGRVVVTAGLADSFTLTNETYTLELTR